MRYLLLFMLLIFMFAETHAQSLDFEWTAYDTSGSVNLSKLSSFTKNEIEMMKFNKEYRYNRGKLTLTDNGNRVSPHELQKPDFPLPCICIMKNDTVRITTALGLMSGLGLITLINKDKFGASFFQEADGTNIFKRNETDSTYKDQIAVPCIEQKLTLRRKPAFVDDEIITGTFNGQFKNFYELEFNQEPALKRNYRAKLVFRCRLRVVRN